MPRFLRFAVLLPLRALLGASTMPSCGGVVPSVSQSTLDQLCAASDAIMTPVDCLGD